MAKINNADDIKKMAGLWKLRQSIADAHLTDQNRILNEIEVRVVAVQQEQEKSASLLLEMSSGASGATRSVDGFFLDRLAKFRSELQAQMTAQQAAATKTKADIQIALKQKYLCAKRQTTWDETKRMNDQAIALKNEHLIEETLSEIGRHRP